MLFEGQEESTIEIQDRLHTDFVSWTRARDKNSSNKIKSMIIDFLAGKIKMRKTFSTIKPYAPALASVYPYVNISKESAMVFRSSLLIKPLKPKYDEY